MKAIVYSRYGAPEVLTIGDIAKPEPGEDEVLIRVHAAEATKGDCELRRFRFAVKWFWLPLRLAMGLRKPRRPVLGSYFSGVVESVGEKASTFRPGDAVFGCAGLRMGAYGEYLCLPERYTIAPKPENISFNEAATVPLGGLNALHFMRRAKIRAGDRVLVNGAGGSIGIFAVQIARAMGAEVTAVDNTIKEPLLQEMGVDRYVDYTREDFTVSGQKYDVIFDMVVNSSWSACMHCLKPNGRYLRGNPRFSDLFRSVLTSWFTGKTAIVAFAGETLEELSTLKSMLEAGDIHPVIDRVFSMHEASRAHRRVETEQRLGMVVISLNGN